MKGRVNQGAQAGGTNRSPVDGIAARALTICALLSFATIAAAQRPGVELRIETKTLELGEAVNVQLVCTNTGVPETPEGTIPDGLELKLINSTPSSSSMTQIFNGRRSQRTTYTYRMRLTALKAGEYTLGPITVDVDGTRYETRPVRIVVQESDTASTAQGDRFIFAEIAVTPQSLYVTETFVATLTIGIRKVRINGKDYQIDLLRKVLDQRRSQFSVFADGSVTRTERVLSDFDDLRHDYEVFRVTKRIRAEEVGEYRVGPVFLKANYPTKLRRGFFQGYEVSRMRKETARAEAVTVEVNAPPEEGRPGDYSGAIGRFAMSVTAKPTRVEQGKPLTLAMSISGSPLEGVAGPDLARQPELASRFDYTNDELVGDVEGGTKTFRRAIFPKQVGEQTIPSVSWSYFDPRKERYVTLTSKPINITVDPASATSTTITLLREAEREQKTTSLTLLTGGISPNFVDPDAVLADQSFALTGPWVASIVVSPLAWLMVTLATRHRARLRTDADFARRRRARRTAGVRISRALRNGQREQQLYGLAESITGYLADRFGAPPGMLTPDEVRTLLATHGIEETTSAEIVDFLQTCDAVRYAPSAIGTVSVSRAATDVSDWIKRIERMGPVSNRPGEPRTCARAVPRVHGDVR